MSTQVLFLYIWYPQSAGRRLLPVGHRCIPVINSYTVVIYGRSYIKLADQS